MSSVNEHGLPRDIPDGVKREVRQRAGFGCLVCGNAYCIYDHIAPAYVDAEKHEADHIYYLCGTCEGKRRRGVLADLTVFEAAKNPAALQKGFCREIFDVQAVQPAIHFGSNVAVGCFHLVSLGGQPILSIAPPEAVGAPFRLNAHFMDDEGKTTLCIVDNEWRAGIENWDVETIKNRIFIRKGSGQIVLVLRTEPPDNFYIERLNMAMNGYELACNGDSVFGRTPLGQSLTYSDCQVHGCYCAVALDQQQIRFGASSL
ncbi:MAG: hypothetical protein WBP94_05435 [Rhodomicrobiaceae bacterium]